MDWISNVVIAFEMRRHWNALQLWEGKVTVVVPLVDIGVEKLVPVTAILCGLIEARVYSRNRIVKLGFGVLLSKVVTRLLVERHP